MNAKDRKEIATRLQKSNRKFWHTLTPEQRNAAVEKYDALTDPVKLSPTDLIESVWNRADGVMYIVMGVILGTSGGLVANVIDRHFTKYGTGYDIFVTVLFGVVVFGFTKLADLVITAGYGHGRLLERLVEKQNQEEN